MTFRIREEQSGALRCAQVARDLSALLESRGYSARFDQRTRVLSAQDAAGHVSRYQLTAAGKLEAYVSAAGRLSRFQLDDHGRVTDLVEPSGRRTHVEYDAEGAPALFVRDERVLARFTWNQDRSENHAEFWDGTHARAVYSKTGRPLEFTNRLNHSDSFAYDASGRLTALLDGARQSTRFEYDEQSQPQSTHYSDGRVERARHTTSDTVQLELDSRPVFEKQLDAAGRPLAVRYADGAEYSFTYDDAGRLLSATGPDAASAYVYAADGKLSSETSGEQRFQFEYDALGLLAAQIYPDGSRAEFSYDPDRRLAQVRWGELSIAISYDAQDRRRTLTTPSLRSDFELHKSGRISRACVVDRRTNEPRFETQYRYDEQNRLVSQTDSELGARRYSYDAESQLLGVSTRAEHWRETFSYDAAGNRTQASGRALQVLPGNRIAAQGSWICRYDERGNLIEFSGDGLRYELSYDLKNQLVEARGPAGVTTFKYDALGRRIEKRSAERTTRFVWSGELLTREIITTQEGETIRDYLYRPGSYEPLALRVDGRYYYYHNDHQGTPQRLTDERGELVWSADYLAFGYARVTVAQVENPLRFLGQYADEETGLHYNRFRYYSPALGRYVSVDPVSLLGGHNLYVFAKNDPLNQSDPLGLFSWGAVAAAAGAMVAAAAVVVLAPAAVPIMLAVVGGAALGVALGVGIAEATSIEHFCLPCFMKGAADAFPTAFGLGFGIAAIAAVCPPLGAVLAVGAAAYGTYAILDEYFGWSSGKPFDQMTDDEKSQALGGLVGGTAGGVLGGLAGGAFGKGLAEGLAEPKGPPPEVEMTRGPPPEAGKQPPEAIHRENIGKNLPPDEAARAMDERTRALAERDAAETRAAQEARQARDAERVADKAALDEARSDALEKGKRVGRLKQDPNATPEQIEQAKRDAQEARANQKALEDDYKLREQARKEAERLDASQNHNGKVYEPAYDPETGEMVVANQGDVPAGESILRPAESLSEATRPGHCAMPRAAGILADDAAAAGNPRPNIQTTDGGYTVRNGEVHPIDACANCQAIRSVPENQIETVSPEPPPPRPVMPMPGSDEQDSDQQY